LNANRGIGLHVFSAERALQMRAKSHRVSATSDLIRQEQLLPLLLDPTAYPVRPCRVQLRQTHSSFVFIASPYVYKIKKPVNFGFLDFSTLKKRRHFCEREVRLNRRLSPDMYLGVVPVSRRGRRVVFGDGDEVLEYAVWMRRLSEGRFLDQRIRRHQVQIPDLDRVAGQLGTFYRNQQPSRAIEEWGRIDRLRISTEENFNQVRPFLGETLSRNALDALQLYTRRCYQLHASRFRNRIRDRRILDCHGDLHLEHIHLTARSLHIFDCIEFSDRLRYVDVANDIAFLAMDLDHNGRPDLARHFAATMAAELDDRGISELLDFYKCYRAFVRGKVESLQSRSHAATTRQRNACRKRARAYFGLALRYSVAGSGPFVLAVMGGFASGKTTLATGLGDELGWPVISSDPVRKQLAGMPLHERGDAAVRRRLYSTDMTRRTYERLYRAASEALAAGNCVILDATFARRTQRQGLIRELDRAHGRGCFIEVTAGDRLVRKRLAARESGAREVSDARLEDLPFLQARHEAPDELPWSRIIRVRSSSGVQETIGRALPELARRQAEA
jgi:aminoglycoside phosphotransferase family enzyme/predicted kinase